MASFAALAFRKLSPVHQHAFHFGPNAEPRYFPSVCMTRILCKMNTLRVSPASSAAATSGVAPSSRWYVRILQRRRSLPSLRLRERPGPGPRLRWPANLAESLRCQPWGHPETRRGAQAPGKRSLGCPLYSTSGGSDMALILIFNFGL